MKKIALILAVVTLLGMFAGCGAQPAPAAETPAATTEAPAAAEAPAATTEAPAAATEAPAAATEAPAAATETPAATTEAPAADALRAGKCVEVATNEEFAAAYYALYEDNSEVNEIRLNGDIKLADFYRDENGTTKDPHWVKYPKYFCIRMPEGTRLDLNGHKLVTRAIQGGDDNTGEASKQYTMGTIIDSFGGGKIWLYSFNSLAWFKRALQYAKDYKDFVNTIYITGKISKAETQELTIPEGVTLRMISAKSELAAAKLTFKPGAKFTMNDKAKEGPHITGTPSIVFEYRDEADKGRSGSEFATEFVQVS